ncbi:abscisic acid stress ripening2, partial [Zea mays]
TDKWFPKPSVCTSNQLARAAAGSHHVGGEAPPLLQPPQEGRGAARRRVRVLRDRGGHRHRRGRVREVQEGGEGAPREEEGPQGRRGGQRREEAPPPLRLTVVPAGARPS